MFTLLHKQPAPICEAEIEAAKQRTRSISVLEGSMWAIMFGCGESFVAPFAVFLRAGNHAMALLGTLPVALGALAQVFSASLAERCGRRRPILIGTVALHALAYLPLFWIPVFFPSVGVPAVVLCFAAAMVFGNMAGPVWTSLMGDVVAGDSRGRYFARRGRILVLIMLASMVPAGYLLAWCQRHGHEWRGYGFLFTVVILARGFGSFLFTRHYEPPLHVDRDGYFSFWSFLRRSPHSNFARFTFAVALMTGATNIAGPFFILYMRRDLHWTYVQWAMNTVVFLLAQFLFVNWWGGLCDRHGNRSVLLATSVILPVLPVMWALSTDYRVLLCVQVLSGCAWSGFNLAVSNFILDAVTPPKRARAFSYFSVVNGAFTLVGGSVIGAYLAGHLPTTYTLGPLHVRFISSLPGVFVVSGLVRLGAALVMLPRFQEVRAATPISPGQILWRLSLGEPILGQISQVLAFLRAPLRRRGRRDPD